MRIGDRVRVIGIPSALPADNNDAELNTTTLFDRCVGRVFNIVGFNGLGHAELEVGEVIDQAPYMSSIWIEQEFLALVKSSS